MYENVFKRVEEKYLLTKKQKQKLFHKIGPYLEKDEYFQSTISNIYFDTTYNDLIINSLEKPIFKEKVRLRSYNIPSLDDSVFLEIKRKYKGVVGKRRTKMTLAEFYDYYQNNSYDPNNQIMKEIDYCFQFYQLKPTIYIAYDRISFKGIDDKYLRITVDSNLRYRREDLFLELGDAGKKYFEDDFFIMEIKTLGSLPIWLAHSMADLGIYPVSFSKYGKIYEKECKQKEELTYA